MTRDMRPQCGETTHPQLHKMASDQGFYGNDGRFPPALLKPLGAVSREFAAVRTGVSGPQASRQLLHHTRSGAGSGCVLTTRAARGRMSTRASPTSVNGTRVACGASDLCPTPSVSASGRLRDQAPVRSMDRTSVDRFRQLPAKERDRPRRRPTRTRSSATRRHRAESPIPDHPPPRRRGRRSLGPDR